MFVEFVFEQIERVFIIKIKLKHILENISESSIETNEINGIKNENKYTYYIDNTSYKLSIESNNLVTLVRENNEMKHMMIFSNKKEKTEYYIKEYRNSLIFNIVTNKIIINDKEILIEYKILENNNNYIYKLEMSD